MDCLAVSLALWLLVGFANGRHQLEIRGQDDREVRVCVCCPSSHQTITLAVSAFLYSRLLCGCSVASALTGPAMLLPTPAP